jgi:nicotinamidase-related amidase
MPGQQHDLHGNVPDQAPVALLLIDVINDLAFPDGKVLLKHALPMATKLAAFKRHARAAGIPSIYVNDNFGRWQSDFQHVLCHCLAEDVCGKPLATLLQPDAEDYFVLKPKHSGFYATTLELLLQALGARTLILTGIAGNICVLFTANDAYMRGYRLVIPADCVASQTVRENTSALHLMQTVLNADVRPSTALDLRRLLASLRAPCRGKVKDRLLRRCTPSRKRI